MLCMFYNTLFFGGEPGCSVLVKMTVFLGLVADLFHGGGGAVIQLLLNHDTTQKTSVHPDIPGSWLASLCQVLS